MNKFSLIIFSLVIFFNLQVNAQDSLQTQDSLKVSKRKVDTLFGIASYYSDKFIGRKTANGEIFSQEKMTAACNFVPLGTWVSITNLRNNRVIKVKINDRLHPKNKRIVDLTYLAAKRLGFLRSGLTSVKVEILEKQPKKN